MNRRQFLLNASLLATATKINPVVRASVSHPFDFVIQNALIVDGTGIPPWRSDLGLKNGQIDALGKIDPAQGREVLDATGLHLSPGFIDIHTHSDHTIFTYPGAESRVFQGITTEVTGNCGSSAAPVSASSDAGESRWTDVDSYLRALDETGISINQALLLGHGTLRRSLAGMENRPLTEGELEALRTAVAEGMIQGAFGLSTGLEYTPGRFTGTAEIVALAAVVARHGGLYASHIRNEEAQLLEAVNEAIEIGRLSGARIQVSHLKAGGRSNWGKQIGSLDLIEGARRGGIDIMADAYPYPAYSTSLTILMPTWALEGGWESLSARLADPEAHRRIAAEVAEKVPNDPGGFELIVISGVETDRNRPLVGMNMREIAASWGLAGEEAVIRLLQEEEGSVGFIGYGMSEENVRRVLSHPLVMIGSDGRTMAPVGEALESKTHPRSYGAFARVLSHYVRETGIINLPTAVKKMTSMPADQLGLQDRGRIARGKIADLVLFDPETVTDVATFDNPHRLASGIPHVFVSGVPVIRDGQHTGARPGRALRKE